jgi:hypothetical protein
MWRTSVVTVVFLGMAGCAAMVEKQLQTVSAGHTGCPPAENEISNIGGHITWNATCKGKVYLCSGVSTGESFSCAPVAQ